MTFENNIKKFEPFEKRNYQDEDHGVKYHK